MWVINQILAEARISDIKELSAFGHAKMSTKMFGRTNVCVKVKHLSSSTVKLV